MAKLRVYKTIPHKSLYRIWDCGRNINQAREICSSYPKGTVMIVKHKSVSSKTFPYMIYAKKTSELFKGRKAF